MLQYLLAPQELLQRIMPPFKKAPSYDGAYLIAKYDLFDQHSGESGTKKVRHSLKDRLL